MTDVTRHVERIRDVVWQRCCSTAAIMADQSLDAVWGKLLRRMYRPIQIPITRAIAGAPVSSMWMGARRRR